MPTPPHIVSEWYFPPIHVFLRSIPDKAGGVAASFFFIFLERRNIFIYKWNTRSLVGS